MSRFRFRPILEQIESRVVPAPVTAAVSGSLILNSSSVNVSGVPVTLSGTSTGGIAVNATAVSNSTGAYNFQNVLPGTYSLAAGSAPGVIGTTTPQSVTVSTGTDVVRNLTYTGGLSASALSLRSFLNVPNIGALTFPTSGTGTALAAERPDSAPTVSTQQAAITRTVSGTAASQNIDMAGLFTDVDTTNSEVTYNITNGGVNYALKMNLFDTTAPQTVANFLDYVESGAYASALFTRNAKDFVLQGGGAKISTDGQTISATTLLPAVPNEYSGVSNLQYTVSMALSGGNPNSGTNQFFINTGNNAGLDSQLFTVFGKIDDAASQAVLNTLNATPTINISKSTTAAANPSVLLDNLPLTNYTGTASTFPAGATRNNYMVINGIAITKNTERLSYTTSSSNTALVTTTVQGSHLTLNYLPGQTGTSTITITAKDKLGISTSQTFNVTVNTANTAPTVAQQIDGQTELVDAPANTIDLATKFTDADVGDTLTFTADSSAPAIVSTTVAGNQLTVTPQAGQTGTSTITVTATDSQGATATQTFQVALQPNTTPTVGTTLSDRTVLVNSTPTTTSLSNAFVDPDSSLGDTLTYSAVSTNTNVVTVSTSGTDLVLTYVAGQTGNADITVTATDSRNATISQTFQVTVLANNAPVAASQLADTTARVNSTPTTVSLVGAFSDPDASLGDTLSYSADSSDLNLVTVGTSGTDLILTYGAGQTGTATIAVTATDSQGATVQQTFDVTVLANNAPVVANQLPDTNVAVDSPADTISLVSAFSDADSALGDTLTYSASSSDTGVVTVSITGSDLIVNYVPGQTGMSTITVTATDSGNATAQQSFLVTVA